MLLNKEFMKIVKENSKNMLFRVLLCFAVVIIFIGFSIIKGDGVFNIHPNLMNFTHLISEFL